MYNKFATKTQKEQKNLILLCDSWYMKKPLVSIPEEYPNLDMIGNVWADSVLYDLPPERTGRKGRPAGHGKQFSIETDFIFSDEKIDGYFIAVRPVITKLFGNRKVLAYVTAPEPGSGKKRLFSVRFFRNSCRFSVPAKECTLNRTGSAWMKYIPLFLWIPVEHRNQLLCAENILVAVQLHSKKPERNRTDSKPDQYRILCHENSAILGQKIFKV